MQFFDLNIPYLESDKNIHDIKTKKEIRLKTMARAVELGYSGIAFNRIIKGSMSQSDGCTIPRFPISSLLKHHASLSSSTSFHRRLLGVPENDAFRQYTRLTVVVDSDAQSSALNSGNPVLKTYDLVAVTPLNQTLFDNACQSAQVDIISIDFGNKLPFRLKLSLVKTAIQRGVYFEILYSSFLDAEARRQFISNAKLLVEWTRGKNLIVSSAAPSFHELRGPNDVSNLLYLLGLSSDRAKAAISKNCRLLIANALRKKQFYKEAIRVEMMPAGISTDPKKPWIVDHLNWDPLSSGEGDLLLEDLAKSFAESGKVSRTVKSIDFTSLIDTVPSQVKEGSGTGFRFEGFSSNVVDFVSSSMNLGEPKETLKLPQESTSLSANFTRLKGVTHDIPEQAMCLSIRNSPTVEEIIVSPAAIIIEEYNRSNTLVAPLLPNKLDETSLHNCVTNQADDMVVDDNMKETTSGNIGSNVESVSVSKDEVSVGSENFDHSGVQADTGQLRPGAFNKTQTGVYLEVQLCVVSNSLQSFDSNLGNHLLQLKPDLGAEADSIESECADKIGNADSFAEKSNADDLTSAHVQQLQELANEPEWSDIHADEIMDIDSSIERNNSNDLVLGNSSCVEDVANELEKNEERHPEAKTDVKESQFSHSVMQVDSLYKGKADGDSLIAKSMLGEEFMMETEKHVHELVKAKHQSLGERKSGNLKAKRSSFVPGLMFPFKRLLQHQFKRKTRKPMYTTKKSSIMQNAAGCDCGHGV